MDIVTDQKQLTKWLAGILARGIAWFFAVKLGLAATEASTNAHTAAEALASLALVAASVWSSLRGRKKLLEAS